MQRRKKEFRPTKFEVALEKGDFQLPSEVPRKWTFEDALEAFITFYQRIGCPGSRDFYWLGIWKTCRRNRKKAASELGITLSALHKRLERLEKNYKALGKKKKN